MDGCGGREGLSSRMDEPGRKMRRRRGREKEACACAGLERLGKRLEGSNNVCTVVVCRDQGSTVTSIPLQYLLKVHYSTVRYVGI